MGHTEAIIAPKLCEHENQALVSKSSDKNFRVDFQRYVYLVSNKCDKFCLTPLMFDSYFPVI